MNDVPLSKLCDTYSGSGELMTTSDFNELMDWYENEIMGCQAGHRKCITFQGVRVEG